MSQPNKIDYFLESSANKSSLPLGGSPYPYASCCPGAVARVQNRCAARRRLRYSLVHGASQRRRPLVDWHHQLHPRLCLHRHMSCGQSKILVSQKDMDVIQGRLVGSIKYHLYIAPPCIHRKIGTRIHKRNNHLSTIHIPRNELREAPARYPSIPCTEPCYVSLFPYH